MIGKIFKYGYLAIFTGCIVGYVIFSRDNDVLGLLQQQFATINSWVQDQYILTLTLFFITFTLINALLIPGSLPLMLIGGALFGWPVSLALTVAAGTLGSLFAFLGIRYWFAPPLRTRYARIVQMTDRQIARNGMLYLLILRVSPGIPTNVISIAMALTQVPLIAFFSATLIGIVPWYAVYALAGETLMQIESLGDIVSLNMLLASAALAGFLLLVLMLKERFGISGKAYREAG